MTSASIWSGRIRRLNELGFDVAELHMALMMRASTWSFNRRWSTPAITP